MTFDYSNLLRTTALQQDLKQACRCNITTLLWCAYVVNASFEAHALVVYSVDMGERPRDMPITFSSDSQILY